MTASSELRVEPGVPVTVLQLDRVSLVCREVSDGDGIGLMPGQRLTDVVDEREHAGLVNAIEHGGTLDLPLRHRDGRWLRLRARIGSEPAVGLVLFDDTTRARREAAARIEARALRAFSRATTLADAVQPLMEALGDELKLRFVELWLIDHRTGTLRRAASVSRGLPPFHMERTTAQMEQALQEGLARVVIESEGIVWVRELRDEPRLLRRKEAILDGMQGVIGVRIGNHTRELGALLLFTDEARDPDDEILGLLERLAQQFSLLTLNLRRGELLQRSQRRLRFITDLSHELDIAKDPGELARNLLDAFVPRIADAGIVERDQRRRIERTVAGADGIVLGPLEAPVPPLPVGRGRVDEQHPLRALGARHALVAPIATRGSTLGRLILLSYDDPFDDEEELIAREASRRAGEAIEHAQLFSHRSHIARTLQESLLPPSLPAIEGFEVAARYHAAGDGIDSGGDFYDLFATGGSSWAAMIGDVQGKGPGAAAITALARYTLRAAALRARRPSRILALLNDALYSNEQTDRCCTVAFARIVVGDGSVHAQVCLAGHLPPLLRAPDGSAAYIGVPGRFLGCFPDTRVKDVDVDIPRGGALIFFTDGVTEARSPAGEEFGDRRVEELIAGLPAGATADAIASTIEQAVLRWQRNDLIDDVAILVLRWAAP